MPAGRLIALVALAAALLPAPRAGATATTPYPASTGADGPCAFNENGFIDTAGVPTTYRRSSDSTIIRAFAQNFGVLNCTTVSVAQGVVVTARGPGVIDLRATGDVQIDGYLGLSGSPGGCAGGFTVEPFQSVSCGAGGLGGNGFAGSPGSAPGPPLGSPGGGGAYGGGGPGLYGAGGGGGGHGGGGGGASGNLGAIYSGGSGGGTGGAGGTDTHKGGYPGTGSGASATAGGPGSGDTAGGGGGGGAFGGYGSSCGNPYDYTDSRLFPGSGGGGGGSGGGGGDGGGGGGGGGALRVITPGTVTIGASGGLVTNGGGGGNALGSGGGGGGGGSGGSIQVFAPAASVAGQVKALGGVGGLGSGTGGEGGSGGVGFTRIDSPDFVTVGAGVVQPTVVQCGYIATHTPDALVRKTTDPSYIGDGIYGTDGAGQTRAVRIKPGRRKTFDIAVENEGSLTSSYLLAGPGSSGDFILSYVDGTTNVTSQVVAGTYSTGDLAPGFSHSIQLQIKVADTATIGSIKKALVTATASLQASAQDAVAARAKVVAP